MRYLELQAAKTTFFDNASSHKLEEIALAEDGRLDRILIQLEKMMSKGEQIEEEIMVVGNIRMHATHCIQYRMLDLRIKVILTKQHRAMDADLEVISISAGKELQEDVNRFQEKKLVQKRGIERTNNDLEKEEELQRLE
ncbi:hypothetical protein HHI36_020114 [Cryptolaemus montrouzieri]|uniref:Uncharacterized protein n=1 Tax=Cryptolaemus montrouzieri TaxID=559131 RepID=A0ABD2N9Q9_9CUCU